MTWQYTNDIPEQFFTDEIPDAQELDCDPLTWMEPFMNESGLKSTAHNPNGNAVGINQFMPATLHGIGYPGTWQDFIKLNADEQLPWLMKYYAPYKGKLINATAVYMVDFCPAWVSHAGNPDWKICSKTGEGHDSPLSQAQSAYWYKVNASLDKNHDGFISVSDLTLAIEQADKGPRWEEIVARIQAAQGN